MKIKIGEAKRKDLSSILKLEMDLSDYHKEIDLKYYKSGKERKNELKKRLLEFFAKKRRNRKILLAKTDNKIIGYFNVGIHKPFSYCREKRIGQLYQAYVDKKFQRKGVGKLLFGEMLNWFKKRKIKFVEVQVDSRNQIAISAYKKYGFFEFQKRMRLDL